MSKIEKTVFISYRRTNVASAQLLYEKLTERGYSVFFDFKSLRSGDFEQLLLRGIESKAHFLVLLTPSALERCHDHNDWLRREIEHAIKKKRNIIPVVFHGFDFAEIKRNLPKNISEPFSKYNAFSLPKDYIEEYKINELEEWLNIPLDMVVHPPTPELDAEEARQKKVLRLEIKVKKDHLSAERYFEKGYNQQKLGNWNDAISDYDESIRLNPKYIDAYNNRGNVKYQMNDIQSAFDDYNRAILLNPKYFHAYLNRGNLRRDIGDYDGALKDYSYVIDLNPLDADAYTNRGAIKRIIEDYNGALIDYNKALSINQNHSLAYNNRGLLMYCKNNYDEAIKDYTCAINITPDYSDCYYNRGNAFFKKQNYIQAIEDYNYAIYIQPNHADYYCNRGIAKAKKGDVRGAVFDYKTTLNINPNHKLAKINLERILKNNFTHNIMAIWKKISSR